MTKKNIWVKLLIVALIIAMVGAFFISCKDKETPNDPDDNDEEEESGSTEEAVNALLGVIDDAIAALSEIDNVGNLGTDAYIDLAIEQEGVTKKIRIDLDLSLDLLNQDTAGDAYTGYAFNGFGFTISVDEGDGNLDRVFGIWYVDDGEDADNYIYLSGGGQNMKIDALTLSSVLEKYNVNANVAVGSVLQGIGSIASNPDVSSLLGMLPSFGLEIGYKKDGNNEIFSLNIKELFNPSEDNALGQTLDEMLFMSDDFTNILSALKLDITSIEDIYNMLPDVSLEIIGNYSSDGTFEGVGLGLAVGGKSDGFTIPTTDGNGIAIVEDAFPDTNLSAVLGFDILTGDDAYNNVSAVRDAAIAEGTWNEIGVLNFAFEGTVTLGQTEETAKTYSIEFAADINAAKLATVDFTRRVYYKDAEGNYVTDADGNYVYTDWFYMNAASSVFGSALSADVINTFLTSINNLYLKVQNVDDPDDILLIALTTPFSSSNGYTVDSGNVFVKLTALDSIMSSFGLDLKSLLGSFADTVLGLEGNVPVGDLMSAITTILPDLIYNIPDNYKDLGAVSFEPVAPSDVTAQSLSLAEAAASGTGSSDNVMTILLEVLNKVMGCISVSGDSITAEGSGADYTIDKAVLDFNLVASLLKNADGIVNGVNVAVNKFIANYNNDEVVTSVIGNVQVGGTGNLFSAEVTVNQTKSAEDADDLNIYIAIDVTRIGYGCASTSPVAIEVNGNSFVSRTGDLFLENVGWSISKTDVE